MKRKTILLACLAFVMVLAMGIAPAMAYFTDHHTVNGGLTINVEPSTDVHEWYGSSTKHVVITNAADATSPVYVRARAYSSLDVDISGDGWSGPDADGWYYYGTSETALTAVAPGGQTNELTAAIGLRQVEDPEVGENYNVIVVYESTPVQYDASGTAYADWTFILDSGN